MGGKDESVFVKVLETDSLSDIALIRGTLEAEEINFFIQGENLRFLRPLDPAVLLVEDKDVDRVRALLQPLGLKFNWLIFDSFTPGGR